MLRPLTINPVLNGFVVTAGCQTLVFTSIDDLGFQIVQYYKNPDQVEKLFIKHAVNKTMDGPTAPGVPPQVQRAMAADRELAASLRGQERIPNPTYETPAPTQCGNANG